MLVKYGEGNMKQAKVLNEKELSKLFKVCENFYTKNSNEEKHTHPHSQEDC